MTARAPFYRMPEMYTPRILQGLDLCFAESCALDATAALSGSERHKDLWFTPSGFVDSSMYSSRKQSSGSQIMVLNSSMSLIGITDELIAATPEAQLRMALINDQPDAESLVKLTSAGLIDAVLADLRWVTGKYYNISRVRQNANDKLDTEFGEFQTLALTDETLEPTYLCLTDRMDTVRHASTLFRDNSFHPEVPIQDFLSARIRRQQNYARKSFLRPNSTILAPLASALDDADRYFAMMPSELNTFFNRMDPIYLPQKRDAEILRRHAGHARHQYYTITNYIAALDSALDAISLIQTAVSSRVMVQESNPDENRISKILQQMKLRNEID